MVRSCDLSPSSARNTTPRLSSVAASMAGDLSTPVRQPRGHRTSVEGLTHRPNGSVRRPGLRQYVDTTIWGYSPSLTKSRLATLFGGRQPAREVRIPVLKGLNFLMRQAASPELRCRDG